ncbi:YtkA-like [Lentzea fradiae]|uniref:YtkA-like n=1 Tax=Lentzea fradiae TaxID=200378 RepID=A0A1G7NP81_9PSEU|nr:FixH family protein [Lentzea fradiae]SDF75888.1 YtkA-like [Lentzea fradiae]
MRRTALGALTGVIALVAVLLVLWPRGVEAQPQTAESTRYRFVLTPSSTKSGSTTLDLMITDLAGNAARGDVTVEPAMPRMGHALAPITAAPVEPGHYRVGDVGLFMAGQWEITVSLSAERVVIPLLLT